MMKFYANLFALTADSISEKSIRRLRWLTLLSLPILPLTVFLVFQGLPNGYLAIPFMIVFMTCAIATVTVLLARIVNRVWAPDKYLDEWEKDLKRKSMSLAFMVMIYVALSLGFALDIFGDVAGSLLEENPIALVYLCLFLIVGSGFYTQIFKQLSLIEPMEEDELDASEYVVTSVRSVLGVTALITVITMSALIMMGYYSGHRSHDFEHDAAQEACGALDVDTHKKVNAAIEVTCEGSDGVIRLDKKTLKPL